MSQRRVFKVVFVNQGKIYELYAKRVDQGSLYGFVEVADLQFDDRSTVVLDPSAEKQGRVFRRYLHLHTDARRGSDRRSGETWHR